MKRSAFPLLLAVAGCSAPQAVPLQVALPPPRPAVPVPVPVPAPVRVSVPPGAVDAILVDKSERTLTLFGNGAPLKTYGGLQLGDAPLGPKHFEGDERTPEGRYVVDYRNPRSAYHLSLHISYPEPADRAYAASRGHSPGGEIFIHGQPNALAEGRMEGDWTDGCIALSNAEIEELWRLVPDGTPIEIRP